ncbi:MAG: alpha/beta fold hydrolase [Colwellia sp.]
MYKASFTEESVLLNGVNIAYQCHGSNDKPTILLIHGLASPLTGWPPALVDNFVEQGFHVVLLDNRDMGKSSLVDDVKIPHFIWTALKLKFGFKSKVPYQLEDLMNDTIALLDHLELDKVHVIGASMGGMISQLMAINHPERLLSLTSIMSTTGNKRLPKISADINKQLAKKPKSSSFEDLLAYHKNKWRIIGSPAYPATPEQLERYVTGLLERGISSKGTIRQILAILAASNREPLLKEVKTPSLILHGDSDVIVHVDGAKATAKYIPNSKLKIYPGMGHDIPVMLIDDITTDIVNFISKT